MPLILLLSACSLFQTKPVVNDPGTIVPRAALNLPKQAPLALDDVQWVVITPENASAVFADLKRRGIQPVLFGLTGQYYQNLSTNNLKIRQYLQTQSVMLLQYQSYYEAPQITK
jgi:hypothetical protein